ncbi:MAG: hypothetical protein KGQ54_03415 [Verrucomicrobia bacterium]|nr:hypothetical protein [Verrucomicrobiota bacterium]
MADMVEFIVDKIEEFTIERIIPKLKKFAMKALCVFAGLIVGLLGLLFGPSIFTHVVDILCTPLASLTIGKILLLIIYAYVALLFWFFLKCLMGDEDEI